MKHPASKVLLLALAIIAAGTSGLASAQHRGPSGYHGSSAYHGSSGYYGAHSSVRFGFYFGGPWYGYGWPGYYYGAPYYSPYYYPPAVAAVPVSPPTYVEQGPVAAPAQVAPEAPQPGYWYYCADARAYYPYVKECPGGWQRVTPQPPSG